MQALVERKDSIVRYVSTHTPTAVKTCASQLYGFALDHPKLAYYVASGVVLCSKFAAMLLIGASG
jgi:hypothetical protein